MGGFVGGREVFNGLCVGTAQNKTKVVAIDHESHRRNLRRNTWFAEQA